MNMQEAKATLIGQVENGDSTLDGMADALLQRVAEFVGECVGGDSFCGFSIDETRDENGILQGIKLVACDNINGEPVRREGKFRLESPAPKLAPESLARNIISGNFGGH